MESEVAYGELYNPSGRTVFYKRNEISHLVLT